MLTQNVTAAESALLATIRQAAASLNECGTGSLAQALAELQAAREAALSRLRAGADAVRQVLAGMADDASGIAAQLHADVFGPAEQPDSGIPESANPAMPDPVEQSAESDVADEIAATDRGVFTEAAASLPLPTHVLAHVAAGKQEEDADAPSTAHSNGKPKAKKRR